MKGEPAASRRAPLLGLVGLVALSPGPALGQGAPPVGGGTGGPQAGLGAAEAAPVPRWTLGVGVGEVWEENPAFETEGGSSFATRANAHASRSWRGPRAQLSLGGAAGGKAYHSLDGLDRWTWSASGAGSWQASRRVTLGGRYLESGSTTRDSALLVDSGLLLQEARTRTSVGRAWVTAAAGKRSTLNGGVRYEQVRFDSDSLRGGHSFGADAGLARGIGTASSLLLNYSFARIFPSEDASRTAHTVHLGWTGRLGQRWTAQLALGPQRLLRPDEARWLVSGSADLSASFRRGSLAVSYAHTVNQAFGLARERILDLASVGASHGFTERFTGRIHGGYGFSRDPFDREQRFHTFTGTADLTLLLTRELSVAVGGRLDRRNVPDSTEEGRVRGGSVSATLAWEKTRW